MVWYHKVNCDILSIFTLNPEVTRQRILAKSTKLMKYIIKKCTQVAPHPPHLWPGVRSFRSISGVIWSPFVLLPRKPRLWEVHSHKPVIHPRPGTSFPGCHADTSPLLSISLWFFSDAPHHTSHKYTEICGAPPQIPFSEPNNWNYHPCYGNVNKYLACSIHLFKKMMKW